MQTNTERELHQLNKTQKDICKNLEILTKSLDKLNRTLTEYFNSPRIEKINDDPNGLMNYLFGNEEKQDADHIEGLRSQLSDTPERKAE